jgi:4-amino-4-deoxy-L-arabinose transferase-like glycosyltransferase
VQRGLRAGRPIETTRSFSWRRHRPSAAGGGQVDRSLPHELIFHAAAIILIVTLTLPAFFAGPARLTSDESLYSAEALNIAAGKGLTYPSGEPIVHRAPLYPAMLAVERLLLGPEIENLYWLPRLATAANALLVYAFARMLFGPMAGFLGGVLAGATPYLNSLGTTLFLDGVLTTFVLLALLTYWKAFESRRIRLNLLAGLLLGLAILVKESAVLFVPLAVVVPLLAGERHWVAGAVAWAAGVSIAAGWWWVWVFVHTGTLFQVGGPGEPLVSVLIGAAVAGAGAIILYASTAGSRRGRTSILVGRVTAVAIVVGWSALFIFGLEQRGWDYPRHYLTNVPAYMATVVAGALIPAPIIALAWVWALVRSLRGDRWVSVPAAAGLLFLPFFFVVANRDLSLRDLLPLIYLSFVLLGGAAVALLTMGERIAAVQGSAWPRVAGGALILFLVGVTLGASAGRFERSEAVTLQDDWNNRVARDLAFWLTLNVAPGTPVMSTRLYYSHVYYLTDARFPVHQLPTVLVRAAPGTTAGGLQSRSTLFRWEDHLFTPRGVDARWLYLTAYGAKGYFVGLNEEDLLEALRTREIRYVIVSTTDAGFSSPSMHSYLDNNPAFRLVYEKRYSEIDETRVYQVSLAALHSQPRPLQVTRAAYSSLLARVHGDETALSGYLERLNPSGWRLVPY